MTETTQERIAVYEKATGKIVAGVMAPTKKYLFAWLEEHPTFEVLKSSKQSKIASSIFDILKYKPNFFFQKIRNEFIL